MAEDWDLGPSRESKSEGVALGLEDGEDESEVEDGL